jgi:hypothetical protein
MATMSTPVIHQPDADAAAEPAAAPARPTATRTSRVTPRTTTPRAEQPATPPRPPAPVERAATPAPTPAAAKTTSPAPLTAEPAPATVTKTVATETNTGDTAALAGAGAAGLLLIGGVTYALTRRRKHEQDEDELLVGEPMTVADANTVSPAPNTAEPAFAAPRATPAFALPSSLPNGFDLSRFGRHTQAAYRGPTPDNPSHSLRKRLRRAAFFDRRERMAAEAGIAPPAPAAAKPARDNEQLVFRPGRPMTFGFRPAYQS